MKSVKVLAIVVLLVGSISAFGQAVGNSSNAGTPENAIFHGSDIDRVQLTNGGLSVNIDLIGTAGRGLSTGYKLVYNSRVWRFHAGCAPECNYDVQLTKPNVDLASGGGPRIVGPFLSYAAVTNKAYT